LELSVLAALQQNRQGALVGLSLGKHGLIHNPLFPRIASLKQFMQVKI
jgi:hypothetical protein